VGSYDCVEQTSKIFDAKIFTHFWEIAVFVLGRFILFYFIYLFFLFYILIINGTN